MFEHLHPGNKDLFAHLLQIAQRIENETVLLRELLESSSPDTSATVTRIREEGHQAEALVHEAEEQAARTIFMLMERTDALEIAAGLERIEHAVRNAAAHAAALHRGSEVPAIVELADVLVREVRCLKPTLLRPKDAGASHEVVESMEQIRADGDEAYYRAVESLVTRSHEAVELLRAKDQLDRMHEVLERCSELADALERLARG